jgi:cytochrome b561
MKQYAEKESSMPVPGYHPITRWLHAGLVLGVIFQLICAVQMAHPDHDEGGHGSAAMVHADAAAGSYAVASSAHDSAHGHSVHGTVPSVTTSAHAEPMLASSMQTAQASAQHEDSPFAQSLMSAHRSAGVVVALIVLANLVWALMLRGEPRKRQMSVLLSVEHWREAIAILKHLPGMMMGKRALPAPGNSLSLIVEMFGMLTMTAMAVSGSIIWSMWTGPGNKVSESAELWMEVHGSIAILLFLYLAGHVSMAVLHWRSGDSVFARILPWGQKSID